MKKLLLAVVIGLLPFISYGTHVMGGEVTYRFLGIVGTDYQYEIRYDVYTDTVSNFPNGIFQINTAVYNAGTNAIFGGPRILNRVSRESFKPVLPPGCNVPGLAGIGIHLNVFLDTILLPTPFSNYFTWYEVCCRNNVIDNLVNPGGTGNVFLTELPANFIQNSSPQFNDPAVPFLCQADTTAFSNNATDPDGDFLVYKFVDNLNSQIAAPGNPQPGPPATYNPALTNTVPWAPNHSLIEPFGPGSYAFINSTNGLTEYYAPNAGEYNLTIEIEEYRDINNDGIDDLIGTTRRELQFLVRACSPNSAPDAMDVVVNGTTIPTINGTANIDINEGDVLSFNVNVTDPENDSMEIFMEGDIIDGTNGYSGPLATFPPAAGIGNVSSTFNWAPTCGITGQFVVRLNLNDYGCPPKNNLVFYNINVREFESADQLFVDAVGESSDSVCFDGDPRKYYTTKNPTALKQWEVFGGTINGPSNQDTVDISWTATGIQTVRLIETSVLGCADTAEFDVVVVSLDSIISNSDTIICEGGAAQLLATGSSSGYVWSPSNFLTNPNIPNPVSAPPATTTYTVKTQGGLGCSNVDTVTVEVSIKTVDAGNAQGVCHADTITLDGIPESGLVYSWTPATFLDDSTSPNPQFFGINTTTSPIVQRLFVTGLDTITTCTFFDSVDITIYPLPNADAGINDTICSDASTAIGTILSPTQTCVWSTSLFLNDSNVCIATVTPFTNLGVNESFEYVVEVTDWPIGCVDYDTVNIVAKPLPRVFAGRDTVICSDQSLILGDAGEIGYNYSWVTTSPTPVVPTNGSNPFQFFTFSGPGNSITHQSIVTAFNTEPTNLCVNLDTVEITVFRLPDVVVIPDTSICSQESIQVGGTSVPNFSYTWNSSFGLSDSTVANPTLNINNPTDSSWFFNYQLVVLNTLTGCIDSADFDIEIRPLPVSDAGPDIAICSDFSDTIGALPTTNYTYVWTPVNGLSSTTVSNPVVTLTTAQFPDSALYIVNTELNACFSSDTVQVRVNPLPQVDSIFGGTSICPDLQDVEYYIIDTLGFIDYQWFAVGGSVEQPSNNDTVFVDWGPANPNAGLFLIPTNEYNCKRDTVSLPIAINTILTSPPPVGDTSVCLGTAQNLIYGVPYTTGYTYTWSTPSVGHTLLPIGNGNQVLYTFNESGTAQIFVEQTVTTVTSTCLGFSDTLTVIIHPDPVDTIPIMGDTSLCEFSSGAVYQINGFANSTYAWNLSSGGTLTADTSNTASVDWGSAGTYTLTAFETSEFGCTSGSVQLDVNINPLPAPSWGPGDSVVCPSTEFGNTYNIVGFNNSSFIWTANGGTLVGGDSSSVQTIDWDLSQAPLSISVSEITEFGCSDVPLILDILADTSIAQMINVSLDNPEDTSSLVSLAFNKGNTSTIADTLVVQRKALNEVDWLTLGQVDKDETFFVDTFSANRIDNTYEYRITTTNLCQLQTASLPHNTLRLQGEGIEDEDRLLLSWNAYNNWPGGVQEYQIYRKLDTQTTYQLYEVTSSLDYTDFSANDAFDHWFFIRAIENGGLNTSESNAFKVEFENLPFIANVITPNNDGQNDFWLIDNRELYGVVFVQVVDRYGNILYENDNYQNDWNGDDLNPGTYFFVVKIPSLDITSQGALMIIR